MKKLLPSELYAWRAGRKQFYLVDMREKEIYEVAHIHGAMHRDAYIQTERENRLQKGPYIFYGEKDEFFFLEASKETDYVLKGGFYGWNELCKKLSKKGCT